MMLMHRWKRRSYSIYEKLVKFKMSTFSDKIIEMLLKDEQFSSLILLLLLSNKAIYH